MKRIFLCIAALVLLSCSRGGAYPESFRDLDGQPIGVLTTFTQQPQLERNIQEARYLPFEDLMSMSLALRKDQIKGFVCRRSGSEHLLAENPGFRILPGPALLDTAAVAFRPEDGLLAGQFNAFLQEIRQNGTLAAMQAKWFGQDGKKHPYPHNHDAGEPLRVGVEVGQTFFTYVSEDEEVGFEPELMVRFGEYVGRPVRFVEMTGSGMVPALKSGRVDALVSGITPTLARQRGVLFSQPYDISELCLVVRQHVARQNLLTKLGHDFQDNLVTEKRYLLILEGLWTTLIITFFSMLLGGLLGVLLCLCRMSRRRRVRRFAEAYCSIVEGIPILVLLLLMFYVVFAFSPLSGKIVAILTFSLHFASGACECFYSGVESVSDDQRQAGLTLGLTRMQTIRHIVMPQAAHVFLPLYKGRSITLLENTSIVGFIAIKDLTKVVDIVRSQTYDALVPLGLLAVIYFLLTRLLGVVLDRIGDLFIQRHAR